MLKTCVIILLGFSAFLVSGVVYADTETAGDTERVENLVRETRSMLETFKDGIEQNDVEKIMSVISDRFVNHDLKNKETLAAYLNGYIVRGDMNSAEVSLDYVDFYISEDGQINCYPIEVMVMHSSARMELTIEKEGDAWMIVGMEIEGV